MILIATDVDTAAEAQAAAAAQLPRLLGLLWPPVWAASTALAAVAMSRFNRRVAP